MKDLWTILPANVRKKARRVVQPAWCSPMLATLAHEAFSDREWLFEPKLDGIRCLTFRKGGQSAYFREIN